MMKSTVSALLCLFTVAAIPSTLGFAFLPSSASRRCLATKPPSTNTATEPSFKKSSSLSMVETNVILGGGIAVAGLVAGVGILVFAENMGERSKARGGGLSDGMATKITGMLMEDVEVDTVADLSSLTEKLEMALKETGGAGEDELKMSEEDKKRIAAEAEDGW